MRGGLEEGSPEDEWDGVQVSLKMTMRLRITFLVVEELHTSDVWESKA
jgi:hypothetical protein